MNYPLNNRKRLLASTQNLVIGALFLTALFYCLHGQHPYAGWGGDYAGYLTQTREMLAGHCVQPYYLYNPKQAYLAPPVYPMGFPLLLSLFYKGIDNQDIIFYSQINSVLWWLTGLVLFFILRSRFGSWASLTVALFWIFNPIFFQFRIYLLPDVLSTLCLLAAAYWYTLRGHERWYEAVICGFFAGYAVLSRFNCVIFLPAIVLHTLWEYGRSGQLKEHHIVVRREIRYVSILIGTVILCQLAVRAMIILPESEGSYLDQLKFGQVFPQLYNQLNEWVSEIMRYYQLGHELTFLYVHETIKPVVSLGGALVMGLTLVGFYLTDSKQERFYLILCLLMALVVIVWPLAQGMRYSMPLLAGFTYFFAKGIDAVKTPGRVMTALKWGFIPLVFAGTYYRVDQSTIRMAAVPENGAPQYQDNLEAFAYVREYLPENTVVATHHPLILGLYGQRKSCKWYGETSDAMDAFLSMQHVQYLLINNWLLEGDSAIKDYLLQYRPKLDTVWHNERNAILLRH